VGPIHCLAGIAATEPQPKKRLLLHYKYPDLRKCRRRKGTQQVARERTFSKANSIERKPFGVISMITNASFNDVLAQRTSKREKTKTCSNLLEGSQGKEMPRLITWSERSIGRHVTKLKALNKYSQSVRRK
jgi:hypothetical protein